MTTVCAWEKTVVMVKQPGHLTSMKKDRGAGTSIWSVLVSPVGAPRASDTNLELVLLCLRSGAGVEKINGENLRGSHVSTQVSPQAAAVALLAQSPSPMSPTIVPTARAFRLEMALRGLGIPAPLPNSIGLVTSTPPRRFHLLLALARL